MNFVKSLVWLYLAICFLVSLPAAAQLAVSTTQLNFGSVHVGTAATQGVTFTNNGTAPLFFIASFNLSSLGHW